jgi:hypothetical protein
MGLQQNLQSMSDPCVCIGRHTSHVRGFVIAEIASIQRSSSKEDPLSFLSCVLFVGLGGRDRGLRFLSGFSL